MIKDNLEKIREKIHSAAQKSGRDAESIKLVAVSKRKPPELISEAFENGQVLFAENYLQDAREKIENFPDTIKWHFIGHLQSNKAASAAELFDMIETVDRLKIARILDKSLHNTDKTLSVLVQVNIGNEPQKSGIKIDDAEEFLTEMNEFSNLKVCGLMVMPPYFSDPELVRPYFKDARELTDKLIAKGLFKDTENIELSMGMSADFEVAIEEGATLVRVGTALFGPRD